MPFSYSVSNQAIATDVTQLLVDVAALNAQNVLILSDTGDLLTDHVALLAAIQLNEREADAIIRYNAILAAMTQFDTVYFDEALAGAASFVPADNTILTSIVFDHLNILVQINDTAAWRNWTSPAALAVDELFIMSLACDGVNTRILCNGGAHNVRGTLMRNI